MQDSSTIRNCLKLLAVGIAFGFCAGGGVAIYTVITRAYLTYGMVPLAADTVRTSINSGIGTAAVVILVVIAAIATGHLLARLICGAQQTARAKLMSVVLVCIGVCAWAIDAVHQNWHYSADYHFRIFWKYDIAIVLCVPLAVWLLMRIPMQKLAERTGGLFKVLALISLIAAAVLNTGLYFYTVFGISEKPNVILISIDALRPDHIGCYGYHRNTTPNIDDFARNSVLFKKAFAHEPWTLASHMSMLTGLYTITHGVYDWRPLSPRIPTLAEYLKNAGYATLGFVNTNWMQQGFGFSKGFDIYHLLKPGYAGDDPVRAAENQNRLILSELGKNRRRNFFAFIHYYDVHSKFGRLPYDAPPPFNSLFIDDNDSDFHFRVPNLYASDYLAYINANNIALSDAELRHIVAMYDSGIAYMDHCIGELLQSLKAMGLYDNTMIIITADHGEEFQEHGCMLHLNPYYYDVLIRVPLIVKLPHGDVLPASAAVEQQVELIDIMPSVLAYLRIRPYHVQGEGFFDSLTHGWKGKEYVYGLGSENWLYVRSQKWKLMSDDGLNRQRYRLFDLDNDPGELHNVVDDHPEIAECLEEKLRLRIEQSLELRARLTGERGLPGTDDSGRQINLDEQQKERLRSLGYVL